MMIYLYLLALLLLISYTNIHKTQRIPKVIHKILIQNSGTLPIFPLQPDVQEAHNSWTIRNLEYEIKYWTLNDIRNYLIANHPEEYIQTFDCIQAYSGKTNFFRYVIIHDQGGWYSDWKQVCLQQDLLNHLASENDYWFFFDVPQNKEGRVMTAFFGSSKNNILLKNAIKQCIINTKLKHYGESPLFTTGPGMLGKVYRTSLHNIHIPDSLYYTDNIFYYNGSKIVQHKCDRCSKGQNWTYGNNYNELWKHKNYYCNS